MSAVRDYREEEDRGDEDCGVHGEICGLKNEIFSRDELNYVEWKQHPSSTISLDKRSMVQFTIVCFVNCTSEKPIILLNGKECVMKGPKNKGEFIPDSFFQPEGGRVEKLWDNSFFYYLTEASLSA